MSLAPSSVSGTATARPRLLLLDALRLLSALFVMTYHYMGIGGPDWWGAPVQVVFPQLSGVAAYGALGVQLFFIISGFVILMSADGRSVGQFAASRISRLFPAYWASVALAAVLLLVLTKGELNKVTWTDALINMSMLQESIGAVSMDGVYWTLFFELLFYVTIAFFLWRGMTYQRLLAFIFVWPLLGMLSLQTDSGILRKLLIPEYSPLFAVGMGLYLIHVHGHNIVCWLAVGMNIVLAGHQTSTRFLTAMETNSGRDLSPEVVWLLILGAVALVALITTTPLRHAGWKWMSVAGALTYPFYLVHEIWGWWIIRCVHEAIGTWPSVFVALGSTLLMAWLIHRLIERKFATRLRNSILKGIASGTKPAQEPPVRPEGRQAAPVAPAMADSRR